MPTENKQLDMNANRLKTTEQKIHWLENEIKDLEYVLSTGCINRNLKLNQLQMYREHLGMLEDNSNKMIWHPYKDCGDTPENAKTYNFEENVITGCYAQRNKK